MLGMEGVTVVLKVGQQLLVGDGKHLGGHFRVKPLLGNYLVGHTFSLMVGSAILIG